MLRYKAPNMVEYERPEKRKGTLGIKRVPVIPPVHKGLLKRVKNGAWAQYYLDPFLISFRFGSTVHRPK